MDGHIFGILRYIKSSGAHKKDGFNNRPFARWRLPRNSDPANSARESRLPFTHSNEISILPKKVAKA